ncbi:hypothetical protein DYBT9275_00190 [Dyadobacter sp. CECT 9275]|uniref:Inosine/uridine-preferring nucleoside hydrolase domain-containing protein n=1 Tax=Dyadobacter helix TaxID=2822344 RepID=A0A916J801_9BACT|nr:nucleoside hydrolase [Dyadobacter sp. CECT 9275]CAG4988940.1 hypothetical protein DYBT9275_00190 [Dyadobacter sp. CECT 9275]
MKIFLAAFFTFSFAAVVAQNRAAQGISMILDTDIGPDYDDAGAMAIMHALADKGEVNPLAVIASNKNELVAPTIEILNTYFGRPELPIGAPKGQAPSYGATQKWPEMLLEKYPHKIARTSDVPDAVETYRKILSKQPDHTVTIVTIGFLTNLAKLMESGPDQISGLSGMDLIRKKVTQLVSMAGKFPEGREYNVYADSVASEKVFSSWPTPVLFSGFEIGEKIKTGKRLLANESLNSPVKDIYAKAMPFSKNDENGRMSWDQTAVLVAARGTRPYFGLRRGKMIVEGGNNKWQEDPMGPHAYLLSDMSAEQITMIIESLMMWEGRK